MKHNPKILYKYRSLSVENFNFTRDIFMKNELYFPHPDQINDPFDCKTLPYLKGLTKKQIIKYLESIEQEQWKSERIDLNTAIEKLKNAPLHQIIEAFSESFITHTEIGILSFSERYSDILMWGHYSDSHKGICIGFDYYELSSTFRGVSIYPLQVKYPRGNRYPKWNPIVDDVETQINKIYLTKAIDWKYEKEWRVIFPEHGRTLQKINPNAIVSVYLGCQITDDHKEEVINWCLQREQKPKVYEMIKDDASYSLKENEILY